MLVHREHWHNDFVLQNGSLQSGKYPGQLDHCFQTMSLVDKTCIGVLFSANVSTSIFIWENLACRL